MTLLIMTGRGIRTTSRLELVRLVNWGGVSPQSRIVSLDGGRTWVEIGSYLGHPVSSLEDDIAECLSTPGVFAANEPHLSAAGVDLRRRLFVAFAAFVLLCFTPWLWVSVEIAGSESFSVMPLGVAFPWGLLSCAAAAIAAVTAVIDANSSDARAVRRAAKWVYLVCGLATLVLPIVGYALTWDLLVLPPELSFLGEPEIKLDVSTLVIPLGAVLAMLVAVVQVRLAFAVGSLFPRSAPASSGGAMQQSSTPGVSNTTPSIAAAELAPALSSEG